MHTSSEWLEHLVAEDECDVRDAEPTEASPEPSQVDLAEEGGRRGALSPEVESRDEDVVEQVDEEEGRLREEVEARG